MPDADSAHSHFQKGVKAMKRNVFALQFSPDYDMASFEFREAAIEYERAGMHTDALRAHVAASEAMLKGADSFGAGRAMERAAELSKLEGSDSKDWINYMKQAAHHYATSGKMESAVRVWMKIVDKCEEIGGSEDVIRDAYRTSCDILDTTDNGLLATIDLKKQFVDIFARNKMFEDLKNNLESLGTMQLKTPTVTTVAKTFLCLVVVQTAGGGAVDRKLDDLLADWRNKFPPIQNSREYQTAVQLRDAFSAGDRSSFSNILSGSIFTSLPVEIARMAKSRSSEATTTTDSPTSANDLT